MTSRFHMAAINAIIGVSSQRRGVTITVDADENFCVMLESTRTRGARRAIAPQLTHALFALECLADGERVELDVSGNPLCERCQHAFPVCACPGPPALPVRWPEQGLRRAMLDKYA